MNKFVWIFGPSAVGKKTAMLDAANLNQTSELRRLLGLERETPIIPIILPSTIIGADDIMVKNRIHQRISWLDMFYRLRPCDHDSVLLIHGQRIDICNGVIEKLKLAYPDSFPLALYVEINKSTFVERNAKRGYDVDYKNTYRNHKIHLSYLKDVFEEVKIIKL